MAEGRATIAITGSHGLIGTALLAHFRHQGHRVRRVVRTPPKPGSDDIYWNVDRKEIDGPAFEGVDAVIHLAGESIFGLWTEGKKREIHDSRADGTRLLTEALARLDRPPGVLACASGVDYYGDRGDELLTAESPPGDTFLARVVQDWEAAAQPARDAGIRTVHLRQGLVLSSRGGALKVMLPAFRMGVGGVLGTGRQFWSWVSLHDLVRVYDLVLERDDLDGPLNAASPNPSRARDFVDILGDVLHRPTFMRVPAPAVKAVLGDMGRELLLGSKCAVPDRLGTAGFVFHHRDLKDALHWALHEESKDADAELAPMPA